MEADHKEDIDLFENAARNAKDADIRNFASTVQTLHKHHQDAEKIENRVV